MKRDDTDFVCIEPELDFRLKEWGRWAKVRGWVSSCRSIEGRYRPPASEVWATEPRPPAVNSLDAWQVECTWRTGLPMLEKMVLRAYYVTAPIGSVGAWERHKRETCRHLGIHRHEWAAMVRRAAIMVDNRLRRATIASATQQVPPHGQVRVAKAA